MYLLQTIARDTLYIPCYIPLDIGKFGDLPGIPMHAVVSKLDYLHERVPPLKCRPDVAVPDLPP